jgi:Golgi nucleoside diphosphatase
LIDAAREVIPPTFWAHTPITMKATAGLRLLPDDQADAILFEVSIYFTVLQTRQFLG